MMEQYFDDVVTSLSVDDLSFLGTLFENDATAGYKSIKTNTLQEYTGLTEATYRKVMYRLVANKFINLVALNRQHSLYISQYGLQALSKSIPSLKGVGA